MRTIFIGDVHGMLDALEELLQQLVLSNNDHLIFLGDLIDKGPEPVEVVRRVADLQANPNFETTLIRGNHEDKHLRYRRNLRDRPAIAKAQELSFSPLRRFHDEACDKVWNTLDRSLPYLRLQELGILAVHGGIPGNLEHLPEDPVSVFHMPGRQRDKILTVLRTRFISKEDGTMKALGTEEEGDPFWAEVYDGRFGHVVFGHQPFMEGPATFPHATGIDTGAVHGGTLTALIHETNQKEPVSLSVPCQKYA